MTATTAANDASDRKDFDPSVVDGLSAIMSAEALRSLLADLVRDAAQRVERIAEVQVAPGSLKMIERDSHDLKSMGGNFGLHALSESAAAAERAARGGNLESVVDLMPTLIETGRRSLKILSNRYQLEVERAD